MVFRRYHAHGSSPHQAMRYRVSFRGYNVRGKKENHLSLEERRVFCKSRYILAIKTKNGWCLWFMRWGLKPITKDGVKSGEHCGVSNFSNHSLKLCQKPDLIVQLQKRWISVSTSHWQKLHRLVFVKLIRRRKSLVGNLLCNSLNRKVL